MAGTVGWIPTTLSPSTDAARREAAWLRMSAAGAQLVNSFAAASELHRDWRNDVEGFGKLLVDHTPIYKTLMTAFRAGKGA